MIEFEIFSEGGIGKINEDYVLHTDIPSGLSLFIVGDGMGGLAYGATASRLTAKSIAEYLKQNFTPQTPEQSIINALHYANEELAKKSRQLQTKMGASIGMALFNSNLCFYTWLGDVRIYLIKDNETTLLTKDHLAIEGNHSFITRCINGKKFRHPPVVCNFKIQQGMRILMATDGYYLHNDIYSTPETININDDDASSVRISFR